MMVGLEILISIQPGQRHEFLQTIDMLHGRQVKDNDRIGCTIFEKVKSANEFLWVEKWSHQTPLDNYMKTGRFKALLGAIQVLGKLNSIHISVLKQLKVLPG